MEVAGVLPPVEKFGRGGAKISRPVATGATTEDDADAEADDGSDSDAPLMMEEGEEFVAGEDRESKNPPEIDPAA